MRGITWLQKCGIKPRLVGLLALVLLGALPAEAQHWYNRKAEKRLKPAVVTIKPPADPPAVREALAEAKKLAAQFKDSEALAQLQEVLKINPKHFQALCESAVLSVHIGARYSDETRKSAYFDAARRYAERALQLQPEAGESSYAVALAIFYQATLRNARARLTAFRDLRPYVYLATEKLPKSPDAWQLLGRWQFRVAHYNVLERAYSKIVLGGVPDGGDSRAAMASLENARALDPQRLQFCYDLARMYRYQGRRRRAIAVLREADKIVPVTSDELVVSRLCHQMLKPLVRKDQRKRKREARRQPKAVAVPDSAAARSK
jgi:tetratricopeptide (TPR) repeat protein